MIDYFTLALTHALLAWAMVVLLSRADLDDEDPRGGDGLDGEARR